MSSKAAAPAGPDAYRQIGYQPGFDGIRATGALFAVTAHASMIVLPDAGQAGLPELLPGTFVFMDAFFVLSGFLITALLLKEQQRTGGISLVAFYRRRALRLLPALWLLLIAHYIYASIVNYDMQLERETAWSVSIFTLNFRMDNILTARVSQGLTQLWSLSLEEQFYLVWPLIVIFLLPLRRQLRTIVIVLVSAMVFIAVRRYFMWADGADWMRLYTHTDTRADSLLLGGLLAYLWVHNKTPTKHLPKAAWVAAAFIGWGVWHLSVDGDFANRGGYNLLALSWAVILLAALDGRWLLCRVIGSRPFLWLGGLSYGLYLWHVPIQFGVARHAQALPPLGRFALATALTFAVVLFSWTFVEQPLIKYKNRLEGKRARRNEKGSKPVTVPVAGAGPGAVIAGASSDTDPALDPLPSPKPEPKPELGAAPEPA
jgi:peptidoglycan/LPS O-acetylase OafA/YrhL